MHAAYGLETFHSYEIWCEHTLCTPNPKIICPSIINIMSTSLTMHTIYCSSFSNILCLPNMIRIHTKHNIDTPHMFGHSPYIISKFLKVNFLNFRQNILLKVLSKSWLFLKKFDLHRKSYRKKYKITSFEFPTKDFIGNGLLWKNHIEFCQNIYNFL